MYLYKEVRKSGRIRLSIVESYREPGVKHPKRRTIELLGFLDELEKEYDDPIAFFEGEIARREVEEKEAAKHGDRGTISLKIDMNETMDVGTDNEKNFGYVALSHIYHELEIDQFIRNRQRHANHKYDANAIMRLLVFSRLLYPSSKKKDWENRERFFETTNFSLDDVYSALTFLEPRIKDLQLWLHNRVVENYGRDTSRVYYDVTNYYFEIDEQDELRRRGMSKEHRPSPIVQMGLLCDSNGLPIAYELFPGNTSDKVTLRPTIAKTEPRYKLGRVVVVADRGVITGDNIWHLLDHGNGYVFSMSIAGAGGAFQNWVLDQKGYSVIEMEEDEEPGDDDEDSDEKMIVFKIKSRLEPREIYVTDKQGKKVKKVVHEKQVVYYSKKYADRTRKEREKAAEKAKELVANPAKYNRSTSYGAAKYVGNLEFDKKTGEILVDAQKYLYVNEELLEQEARLDGYYAIVTSEYQESDSRILETYRELWRIEESFKITKSDLKTRPVHLSRKDRIKTHFMVCFLSLLIVRILQYRLGQKHPSTAILESLRRSTCTYTSQNVYVLRYYDDILQAIGLDLGIDFNYKYLTQGAIKSYVGAAKKANRTTMIGQKHKGRNHL